MLRDELVAVRYHDHHSKDWKKSVIYLKMCSILCVSSLWHSEEDAFVNIVTEILGKYLIWTPFSVQVLSSRSEDGMISTDPYPTSLQGWHVLLPSSKRWDQWILWSFTSRNLTFPKLQGRTLINIDTPGEDIIRFLSLEDGREAQVVRDVGDVTWKSLRPLEAWPLKDLRVALGKKIIHLESTRRSCTLNPESYTTWTCGCKNFDSKNIEFHSVRIESTNRSERSWSQ